MPILERALAAARPYFTAGPVGVVAGAAFGAAVAGAFLAGGLARDAVVNVRATRVAQAMEGGLGDASLRNVLQSDPSALSLALRHDPFLSSDDAPLSRQEAALAETLRQRARRETARQVAMAAITHPAAQPWKANPLDAARQFECLTEAVYYEARGETPAGQAAVAQVVLNRVRHPSFPKSVCAVVYQGAQTGRCQFSFACNGAMRGNREPGAWARAQRVAERALGGYVMAGVGNATHFHVTTVRPGWRNMVQVANIGAHIFYRFGGRNGAPESFTDEPVAETEYALATEAITADTVSLPAILETPVSGAVEPGAVAAPIPAVSPADAGAAQPVTPARAPRA